MAHPTRRYILQWSKMIAPKVRHLSFSCEAQQPLSFVPGQFITLHIEGPTKILHRSYSIANAPGVGNTLELACAYVEGGAASTVLFNLQPGDAIVANGPFGLFVLKEERPARYVLIATGTGIAPYRSMLNALQHRLENTHPELEIALVFGVRTPDELLFKEEFLRFAASQPRFRFYACYSQASKTSLESHERQGRIQATFEDLALDPQKDIVYLCGNPNMIDDAFAQLTAMGFDKKSVRREKYVFSH